MNIFGTTFDYQARLAKVRKLMEEGRLEALLIHKTCNQYYLSGNYPRLPWYPDSGLGEAPLIIFKDSDPVYVCDWLSEGHVREGTWIKDIRVLRHDLPKQISIFEFSANILKERRVDEGRIGLEEDICTFSTYQNLQKSLPRARFQPASEILYRARAIKDPEEIELIRKSCEIADAAMEVAIETAKPGVRETDVQKAFELEMKRRGALKECESMIMSGARTATYTSMGSQKKIEEGDLILADLGCFYKGYMSDTSRSWVLGKPTPEQKRLAKANYDTMDRVIELIRPGVTCQSVAESAYETLKEAGYGDTAMYFAGHGIGLGPMHEIPRFELGQTTVLEPGMTMSIQPGMKNKSFTLRFEDDALLTSKGVELLTKTKRELI